MQADLLGIDFSSVYNHLSCNEHLLMTGSAPASCGAALVIKNCLVRKYNDGGAAPRVIEKGTLIQVWSSHDEVRFSVVNEGNVQLDSTCLLCKSTDIILVPSLLWGALFPLPPEERVALMRDSAMAERLAAIDVNSIVEIIGSEKQSFGFATVLFKNYLSGLPLGIYYGVQIMSMGPLKADIAHQINILRNKTLPVDCDAVVTIENLRPATREMIEMQHYRNNPIFQLDPTPRVPKSASHHSIRSNEEVTSRRQASRSLDLTNRIQHFSSNLDIPKNNLKSFPKSSVIPSPVVKLQQPSRSLDLPTGKRLLRGRACSSLDSELPNTRDLIEFSGAAEQNIGDDLVVGSLVEIMHDGERSYGVIRWIGRLEECPSRLSAGIEMEQEFDGSDDTRGLFSCPPDKGLFVPLSSCRKDSRFQDVIRRRPPAHNSFGQIDCPVVEGTVPPINMELQNICGKNRGIQGHHNSCYLDATLFAMFAFTSVFDTLLYRPCMKSDIPKYYEVQQVLRDEIVNPLRKNLYVRADRVMKLRTLLEELSSVTGLTSEEKDPEEFLNSLLAQILKAEPFLQLSSGQEAFHYQLFVEKDEKLTVPTVQQLLEQSFLSSNIKLKQLPPCLIVQMPRFGKSFKMYSRILPSMSLDVTHVIENSPRECVVCGGHAELECRECYMTGIDGESFCKQCMGKVHSHAKRCRHVPRVLDVPIEFRELQEQSTVPRLLMHLFAVVCIETSHYVAFLNTKDGWVFFDSMADRKGEKNGYNIPEIVHCPELSFWLSKDGERALGEIRDERELPELAKRLLCDAYMCMYQSYDIMMYR